MEIQQYHVPVLLHESVEALLSGHDTGTYIDGTFGGGGHTKYLLSKTSASSRVIGIDQDEDALRKARSLTNEESRFSIVQGNFGFMDVLVDPALHGNVDGILLDIGVSSHQIDQGSRGFSFQQEGPLDMRMGKLTAITAAEVLNSYQESELASIFFRFGEERNSRKIARAIIENRPLSTTQELVSVIRKVSSEFHLQKTLARIFQALRIEVNRELEMLEKGIKAAIRLLKPQGRIVILSYHSLEDRIVKHYFRSGRLDGVIQKDIFGNSLSPFKPLPNKAIKATDEEITRNPRARSVRMRVALRTEEEVNV